MVTSKNELAASSALINEVSPFAGQTLRNDTLLLDFLSEVGKKVGSMSSLDRLVSQVTQMTRQALNASASSVLLLDEEGCELVFKVAEGESKNVLRQMRLSTETGIAGWVARSGKALVVNDVSQDSRFNSSFDGMTGFSTKSIICVPLVVQRKIIGVIEVLNKADGSAFTESDLGTLTSVASTAAMAIENTKLHDSVVSAYKSTIRALAAAIDAKDHYTRGHSQRVMEYALLGGVALSFSRKEMEVLECAATLHDVGKIGVDENILRKPTRLNDEEWAIMVQHPRIGATILREISFLDEARELILHHHERYDGGGYPDMLKGEAIPVGARVLAIADAFDCMTTNRSYKAAIGVERAIDELRRCSGTQFCPKVVEAFIARYQETAPTK